MNGGARGPTRALDVLSPVATGAQLAPRARIPAAVRILTGLLALALTTGFLWLSIGAAISGLHHPSTLNSVGRGDDRAIIANYLTILVIALIALAASWGVNGVRAGGFPRGVTAAAGRIFTGAAALVYVPLIVCSTVQVLLTLLGAVPQSNGIQSSLPVGLATSLGSGVSEEVFVVAVPIAVFDRFVRWRPTRARWLPPVLTVVVLAAARLSYHVYYGWTALVLLPWAVLSVVFYLRTRALLPLMVFHVAYDSVLQLPGLLGLLAVLVLAALAAVLGVLRVARAREQAGPVLPGAETGRGWGPPVVRPGGPGWPPPPPPGPPRTDPGAR